MHAKKRATAEKGHVSNLVQVFQLCKTFILQFYTTELGQGDRKFTDTRIYDYCNQCHFEHVGIFCV